MKYVLLLSVIFLSAAGCSLPQKQAELPVGEFRHAIVNSVYYWKTVFKPDQAELKFISSHDIGRIYLRMFDVSVNMAGDYEKYKVIPDATVRFDRYNVSQPKVEYVPVVYVTLDALKTMNGKEAELAELIVTRVRNMCSYNNLDNVGEFQLDCDWTASTRESFFTLCRETKLLIQSYKLNWDLSSTIRLHQLRDEVPPVDRGVLMVYNTGNFNNPDATNSIIDPADISPYLKALDRYRLYLDVAYPTYSWQLLYRNRQFTGLTRGIDTADSTRFAVAGPNSFKATTTILHGNRVIKPGDIVRTEQSDYHTLKTVKDMVERHLSDRHHNIILYHLDSSNLSEYTDNEIDSLYNQNI